MPPNICTIARLDHLVLTVASIPRTVAFYQTLGMRHETFTPASGGQRHALLFGASKINLHQHGAEFEPKAAAVMPGSADLCFVVEESVDDVRERLQTAGVEVLEGGQVVDRTGATGPIRSVYLRDPDLNLVELSNY